MISLETIISNKKFSNCLMNASEIKCITLEESSDMKIF